MDAHQHRPGFQQWERSEGPAERGEDWVMAQERVLLYLRALELPPLERLRLAYEALHAAGEGREPVEGAMSALWSLLRKEGRDPIRTVGFPPSREPVGGEFLSLRGFRRQAAVAAAPPVKRGIMISEELDRKPWLTFLQRISLPFRRSATEIFNTQLQFLFFLMILATLLTF